MTGTDSEIKLDGGNVNAGVVRVGDTVRRAVTPNSHNVHRLLAHLDRVGFDAAPKYLGMDDQGREILSFIHGQTDITDAIWREDKAMTSAVAMLRQFHDAAVYGEGWGGNGWAFAYPDTSRHEVICHNDFALYNMVFENAVPVGIIDFDLAGPGPRVRDLAYLAYWMVPFSFAAGDMAEFTEADLTHGCRRLKMLCDVYGGVDADELLDMTSEVLHHMASKSKAAGMVGEEAANRLEAGGHFQHWAKEAAAFDANRARIQVLIS